MFMGFVVRDLVRLALPYVAALLTIFGVVKALEGRGAKKAIATVGKQNEVVQKKADSAARKSGDADARGVRDPYSVR